jgi:hypothetical protein
LGEGRTVVSLCSRSIERLGMLIAIRVTVLDQGDHAAPRDSATDNARSIPT